MSGKANLIYFLIFIMGILALKFGAVDEFFPELRKDSVIWFTAGMLLIIFGIFVTEKHFTRPIDVIVNTVILGSVLLMLEDPTSFILHWLLWFYGFMIFCIAIISFILGNENMDENSIQQKIARCAYVVSGFLGGSKMLFSIVFFLSIISYFLPSLDNRDLINQEQVGLISMIIFWGAAILIEPIHRKLIAPLCKLIGKNRSPKLIGKIVKKLNPDIIDVEQSESAPRLKTGDIGVIRGRWGIGNKRNFVYAIFVGEHESLDKRYSRFYCLDLNLASTRKKKYVYKTDKTDKVPAKLEKSAIYKERRNIIGFIHSRSDIDTIKIKMIQGIDEKKELKEGDLVSVHFYGYFTQYQITNAETSIEKSIDGQSKLGEKIITAEQLGSWDNKEKKFIGASWVPSINDPVFIDRKVKGLGLNKREGVYQVGVVPRSQYPIFIDFEKSVNHHIAVIGKTGTGKSRMVAKILEKMSSTGYKIVVLEKDRDNQESLTSYIKQQDASDNIDDKKTDANFLEVLKEKDKEKAKDIVSVDMSSQEDSGTSNLSDAVAEIIKKIIEYQRKNKDQASDTNQKICVVMEEAYDFIPEWNFGDTTDKKLQSQVSKISQLVLKCRKHNIGFIIISQRTAIVTKTILYQCHTVIALQSVDETSKNFMSSYVSQKYLDRMSVLPSFRAIVVGKGSSCDGPVIVDFDDKNASGNKKEKTNKTTPSKPGKTQSKSVQQNSQQTKLFS